MAEIRRPLLRRRAALGLLGTGLLALTAAACTDDGGQPPSASLSPAPVPAVLDGWQRVALPGNFIPTTLAVDPRAEGSALWVGGRTAQPRQPRVAVLTRATAAASPARLISLRPVSPYARNAEVVSLAVDRGRVAALGGVRDGAHSNVRWSTWRGDDDGLQEFPQGFNTFGGPDAGDLVAMVAPSSGPVIVGTWSSAHGLDAAAWLPEGPKWIRQSSAGTVLASTAEQLTSPREAISAGDQVHALGSILILGRQLEQRPAVWTWPDRRARWTVSSLPSTGRRSEVLTACTADPDPVSDPASDPELQAWGHVDDRLAGWKLTPNGAERIEDLPSVALRSNAGASAFRTRTGGGVAFTGDDRQGRLLVAATGGWRLFRTPDGAAGKAAAVDGRLYVVVGEETKRALWSVDLGPALG